MRHEGSMARMRRIAAPLSPPRSWVRRAQRAPPDLPHRLESDLGPNLPVTDAELDAIEQLLGANLRAFLGAPH